MTDIAARILMALARCCMDPQRRDWSAAMQAEFAAAAQDGAALPFALGCFMAALHEMVSSEAGWFTLTNYALALIIMLPMAALQLGCALFGLPYLYPGQRGLVGALLEGASHEPLIRPIYQAAIPSLALLLVFAAASHLRLAWLMVERDWSRARHTATFALATSITLLAFMSVLFLDATQVWLQGAVLGIELASLAMLGQWRPSRQEHPG